MPTHHRLRAGTAWRSGIALLLAALSLTGCVTVRQDVAAEGSLAPTLAPVSSASPTALPLATPTPEPTPAPTPEPVAMEVIGFLPNWQVEEAMEAMDTELLTMVAFHGVEASGNGRLVRSKPSGDVPGGWQVLQSDEFAQLQSDLQAQGVKVLLTIQRFGWSEGPLGRTENLLSDASFHQRLARQVANLVEERGLDGVNLDFEPMPQALADEFVELVREVRAALDGVDPGLHLSVDVVASLSGYDLAALTADGAADHAVIMGYNFRSDGAATAGSGAPLVDPEVRDLSTTVDEALAQVGPDKLILALPWYGKTWSTESDEEGSATVQGDRIPGPADPAYVDAVALAVQSGRRYEPEQASAWTAYPDEECPTCPAVWRQLWYDDPDSFGAKVGHAIEQGLAGVGIWALGHDAGRSELWSALRHRLLPGEDETPPSGSAFLDRDGVRGEREGLEVVEGSALLDLFASDVEGSGLGFVRVGLSGERDEAGMLTTARTYPAAERIRFPLGDESTGGSLEPGPRSIHVQWRDIAGNWSAPVVIDAWAQAPATMPTPADL